jgi:hypothetical protein
VKVLVSQQRAAVAGRALALANEQPQPVDLLWGQRCRGGRVPLQQAFNVPVETGLLVSQRALVRGNCLADVREDAIDCVLRIDWKPVPRVPFARRAAWTRIHWEPGKIRHESEDGPVLGPVVRLHEVRKAGRGCRRAPPDPPSD